ncbi:MAG TPA: outer membrane beta-barrel domain-containing protein [Anaeromyxobacter sp.]|nr:outer membrane beta-barrel domain-containing protein [Anaeromyxobacter sp.]
MSLPAPSHLDVRMDPARHGGISARATPSRLASALGLLLVLAGLAAPSAPRAQSKSDAFAGKIPPVSAALYRKAGRFELTLSGNLSVNDAFYSKYFGGLKLGYHIFESVSVTAYGAMGLNTKAGSAQVCPSGEGCRPADRVQMWQVPGNIKLMAGVEGAWAPVYGKLNLFSEQVAHFDLGILHGWDWITYQKVLSGTQAAEYDERGQSPGTESTIGMHLGLATRIFLTESIALRLEFRDYFYLAKIPNVREGRGARTELQQQLFAELGVSVFFPFHNRPVQ